MSVTIDGSNIIKALDKIDLSPEELRKALSKSALLVERDAKKNVASTTHGNGELANSITSVVYDDYAEIGTNKKYAVWTYMHCLNRAKSVKAKLNKQANTEVSSEIAKGSETP